MRFSNLLLLLTLPFWLCAQSANTNWSDPLRQALLQQREALSIEKIYVQTDRTYYRPGEIVWLAGYLVGYDNTSATARSEKIELELLTPNGQVQQRATTLASMGTFASQFQLTPGQAGGVYTIRAYTNYQGNFKADMIFEKEITVQRNSTPNLLLKLELERESYSPGQTVRAFFTARNLQDQPLANTDISYTLRWGNGQQQRATNTTNSDGQLTITTTLPDDLNTTKVQLSVNIEAAGQREQISKPVPVVLGNISMQFLPEGGEWIAGLPCRMAYVARNEHDKPADISGTLYDGNDQPILSFTSAHDGLGSFTIPAQAKLPLRVRLDAPVDNQRVYPIADPLVGNWQMTATYDNQEKLTLNAHAHQNEELFLTLRANDQLFDCQNWQLAPGQQTLSMDVSGLPVGVCQVTAFNANLEPQWERLVFLHPQRRLQAEFTTHKSKYDLRDEVKLELEVTDAIGQPVQGNFSLAVVDERNLSFADDKQPHILTQLLLSSELHGEIHEPNAYFDLTDSLAQASLDLVMLTHGWRRFSWRLLQNTELAEWEARRQYPAVVGQVSVYASYNGVRLANTDLRFPDYDVAVKLNANGNGSITNNTLPLNQSLRVRYRGINTQTVLYSSLTPLSNQERFSLQGVLATEPRALTLNEQEVDEVEIVEGGVADEIVMAEDITDMLQGEATGVSLDEVVVVGYGAARRANASGLIVSIDAIHGTELSDGDFDMPIMMDEEMPVFSVYSAYPQTRQLTPVRQFAFPDYSHASVRNNDSNFDQRTTLYWNPNVMTDQNGKAELSFYTADEPTTYSLVLEGLGGSQAPLHAEYTLASVPPLSVQLKAPAFVTLGDEPQLSVVLQNNTNTSTTVPVDLLLEGSGLILVRALPAEITLEAGEAQRLTAALATTPSMESTTVRLSAGKGRAASIAQATMEVYRQGFPRTASTSGRAQRANFKLMVSDPIPGSMQAEVQIFPSMMRELLAGVESLLREPTGCFEQTSSSNYPNIMVLQTLREQNKDLPEIEQRAIALLEKGYKRLASYEVQETGGFSLWGQAPARPALTAFGLLQFRDLQQVWPHVDQQMIERALKYLQGVFEDPLSGLSAVDRAYAFYALAVCGDYRNTNALADLTREADGTNNAYVRAIAARLCHLHEESGLAGRQLEQLLDDFNDNQFGYQRTSPSFVHTVGAYLTTELTGWTIMSAIEQDYPAVDSLVQWLLEKRQAGGRFGPTQPTVQALQALLAYEKYNARPASDGELLISVNQMEAGTIAYTADSDGRLSLDNLGEFLLPGENYIELRFLKTDNPLPYIMTANWQTAELPDAEDEQPLALLTKLSETETSTGQQVRYHVALQNKQAKSGYAPMLLLSAPAGLEWQLWQLKEMQDRGEIDFYEMRDAYLVIYFENIDARKRIDLAFDLVAITAGTYQAPAASAYLYYQDDLKTWVPGPTITIND